MAVDFPSQSKIDSTSFVKSEYNKTKVSDNNNINPQELVSASDFDIEDKQSISKQPIGSSSPVYNLEQDDKINHKTINPIVDLIATLFYMAYTLQVDAHTSPIMDALKDGLKNDVDFISKHGTAYDINIMGKIDVDQEDSLKMQNEHLKKQRQVEQQEKTLEENITNKS